MWEKLEQIARRCAEIGELLTVPEIYGDAKELRRLTQEQKELEPVAQCYEDYRRAERTIAEATELLSDAELRDMAQEELRQAKADKERLYEEAARDARAASRPDGRAENDEPVVL